MIYVGNQTAAWAATPGEPFDYAVAQGFDAFEWFPDKKPGAGWDETDLDARARESIRQMARERRMRLSVHARWQANPVGPEGNWLLEKDLALARDLGAALLNIHLFHELGVEAFVQAIVPLIQQTAKAGLQFAIENTPHHSPEDFNNLFARIRALNGLDTSHVGMCLDMGHANLCSATHNDYLAFFDRLDRELPIIHLHLHENWGDTDSHLPLFTGPAARDDSGVRALVNRLKVRQFSGSAILEQWPQPPSLLNQARDRLLKLWNSKDKGAASAPRLGVPPSGGPAPKPPEGATPNQILKHAPCGFIQELAAGDRRLRSWREKLEFARGLLAREQPPITADELVDLAIYFRFLGTGEIACEEDGRHFRPAHHARISSQIQERLAALTTEDNQFIVRKIYPWLPSSAADFRRPEPLTRIRDIAHRNDIDSELKNEIKTTLQNKLHRCAGPEDLETSSALLARITAPGTTYSPAFVEQFRIFHEELKEFFNAQSLDERLETLKGSVEGKTAELISLFLKQKSGTALAQRLETFRSLTRLREAFLGTIGRKPAEQRLEFLLADIALEDFAFVLLSEIINGCEGSEPQQATEVQTDALVLALKNLELGGVEPAESQALEAEFQKWGKLNSSAGREEVLRLRASLQRCRRLAENFGARIFKLFLEPVSKLGEGLGVEEHAIRLFSESDLRSHLVFQVSKLVSGLLRRIRGRLEASGWDVLVNGRAVGKLKALSALEEMRGNSLENLIVLLNNAAGDEEVPKNVAAIVLAHEMPHLSHLSVRARQAGTVFVTCEEPSELERLRGFEGQTISLLALPEAVTWEKATASTQPPDKAKRTEPRVPNARLAPQKPWLLLDKAETETSGTKAAGVRSLVELSRRQGAGFEVPRGLVVPFGVMEAALATEPEVEKKYRELLEWLETTAPTEVGSTTQRMRELIQKVTVSQEIIAEVTSQLGPSALVVRSSSNCEDLQDFAGAGLYESVINVGAADVASAIRAVWSSLWTERAVLSRREAGIPHPQAHMAVLIQEVVDPDLSFVLHTVNPVSRNKREVYAEIVIGLGETLVSGASQGSPYRLTCDKQSGTVVTLAFANFSQAARANPGGGLKRETVDYSHVELSLQPGAREKLGKRLADIGSFMERELKTPQDIEGALVGGRVFLVQTRPQTGLAARS
jgi:phosphoglucan,water dikinase